VEGELSEIFLVVLMGAAAEPSSWTVTVIKQLFPEAGASQKTRFESLESSFPCEAAQE
jgi:hypothetical protein